MNEQLARELVKSRKAVKQKYQSLKNAQFEAQTKLEETYKPLTQPLQELISTIAKSEPYVKEEQHTPFYETSTPTKGKYTRRNKLYFETASPRKQRRTGKTPNLPHELPSFFETDLQPITEAPSFISDITIGDETPPAQSSESTIGNISDVLEQTRQTVNQIVDTPAYQQWLDQFQDLPRQYIDEGVRDLEHQFDHIYGIVHDMETDKLYLGVTQKPVDIIGKDIKVENIKYPGTVGLYELLFKKHPRGYKPDDLDNYMDILKRTNAYRRNHDPNEQVQGNGSEKYVTIVGPYLQKKGITKTKNVNRDVPEMTISQLSTPAANFVRNIRRNLMQGRRPQTRSKTTEGGALKLNKPNTDYVYWDNVNELVDRLRLLVASMIAGHTGHNNEIISIVEELKEANII